MRTKTFGRLITMMTLSLCVINLMPARSVAWGRNAHNIVTLIANERLSEVTRTKVEALLGHGVKLPSIAYSATDARLSLMGLRIRDSVRIPFKDGNYDKGRDCGNGYCVVEAIKRYKATLASPRESKSQRILALKILVSYVADIHHPLHCIDNNDDEGSDVRVSFFGDNTDLKSVWDDRIIRKTGLTNSGYAKKLLAALSPYASFDTNVDEWANESARMARDYVYNLPSDRVLGNAYYSTTLPLVDERLTKAGVRLAQLIEEAFRNIP